MTPVKSALLAAALCVSAAFAADAQPQYPAYAYGQAPVPPPSWSYNPYTSGSTACPQWHPGDPTGCRDQMPPSYGPPGYWPPPR